LGMREAGKKIRPTCGLLLGFVHEVQTVSADGVMTVGVD